MEIFSLNKSEGVDEVVVPSDLYANGNLETNNSLLDRLMKRKEWAISL